MVEVTPADLAAWTGAAPQHADDDDDFDDSKPVGPGQARRDALGTIEELTPMIEAAPTAELLEIYHALASDLLDFGELDESEKCWRKSLDIYADNPAVRERLSATLRMKGRLRECALELLATVRDVPDEAASDKAWLYLDMGALLERIAPLPGAGPEWDAGTGKCPMVRIGGKGIVPSGKDGDGRAALGIMSEIATEAPGRKKRLPAVYPHEDLSAELCYRKAIELDPNNGEAHKRLADCLAILGGNGRDARIMEESLREFEEAARLMPHDICCATHALYGTPDGGGRTLGPLPMTESPSGERATLDDLKWDAAKLNDDADAAAEAFERNGALVVPGLLTKKQMKALRQAAEAKSSAADGQGSHPVSDVDYTVETKEPANREHRALPLSDDNDDAAREVVSDVLSSLHPVLSRILQADSSGGRMPLLGSGYMRVDPGARGQELHKDVHHYDRHGPVEGMPPEERSGGGSPRTVSIQIQLTDTSSFAEEAEDGLEAGVGGSLEVLPGSHRPDGAGGRPEVITDALKTSAGVVPVAVPPGTVTVYCSRLWHRGGENVADGGKKGRGGAKPRLFCFLTVTEPESAAPPGLIHTMELDDVGRWSVTERGLEEEENAGSAEDGAVDR